MKIKTVIILCAMSLMAVTGCGEKAAQPVTVVDVEKTDLGKEQVPEEEAVTEPPETGNTVKEDTQELEGTVRSIGDAGIVVSKTFTEETEEEGVLLAVEPLEGSGDEVLITVSFSENTKYMLHTVKNGGINGDSDVTKTEASLSDIKEGLSVALSGYFTIPDKEYVADSVIIYKFI